MTEAGWYKIEGDTLLHSPTTVESAAYYLSTDRRDEYELPVDGWDWFDSDSAAREAYGLPPAE
jgi:hypothetical protein